MNREYLQTMRCIRHLLTCAVVEHPNESAITSKILREVDAVLFTATPQDSSELTALPSLAQPQASPGWTIRKGWESIGNYHKGADRADFFSIDRAALKQLGEFMLYQEGVFSAAVPLDSKDNQDVLSVFHNNIESVCKHAFSYLVAQELWITSQIFLEQPEAAVNRQKLAGLNMQEIPF